MLEDDIVQVDFVSVDEAEDIDRVKLFGVRLLSLDDLRSFNILEALMLVRFRLSSSMP